MDKSPLSRLLFFNLLPVTVYFLARSYKTKIADLRISSTLVILRLRLAKKRLSRNDFLKNSSQ